MRRGVSGPNIGRKGTKEKENKNIEKEQGLNIIPFLASAIGVSDPEIRACYRNIMSLETQSEKKKAEGGGPWSRATYGTSTL